MIHLNRRLLCVVILGLSSSIAYAKANSSPPLSQPIVVASQAQISPIQVKLEGFNVQKDKSGKEILVPASTVQPDQKIEYVLTYQNESKKSISQYSAVGTIPTGTYYVSKSAKSSIKSSFEISIDNGSTWHPEPYYKMEKDATGKTMKVLVKPEEYQRIRWNVKTPLKAGKTERFSYQVMVGSINK